MSHVVTIQSRSMIPPPWPQLANGSNCPAVQGTAELFSGSATGLIIRLPGWQYPVVADIPSGTLSYDNYGGQWGRQEELGRFMQSYAVKKLGSKQPRKATR